MITNIRIADAGDHLVVRADYQEDGVPALDRTLVYASGAAGSWLTVAWADGTDADDSLTGRRRDAVRRKLRAALDKWLP